MAVAGFGDSSPFCVLSSGVLGGDQSKISHEFAGIVKSTQVANFRNYRRCYNQGDTPEGLDSFDHWTKTPLAGKKPNLFSYPLDSLAAGACRIHIFLQCELLGFMFHLYVGNPAPVCKAPIALAAVY